MLNSGGGASSSGRNWSVWRRGQFVGGVWLCERRALYVGAGSRKMGCGLDLGAGSGAMGAWSIPVGFAAFPG